MSRFEKFLYFLLGWRTDDEKEQAEEQLRSL